MQFQISHEAKSITNMSPKHMNYIWNIK